MCQSSRDGRTKTKISDYQDETGKSFMTENGPHFQIYTISNNLYNFLFVIQLLQDLFYQLARQYLFIFSVVSETIFCICNIS